MDWRTTESAIKTYEKSLKVACQYVDSLVSVLFVNRNSSIIILVSFLFVYCLLPIAYF
jgi:hypothetical protein